MLLKLSVYIKLIWLKLIETSKQQSVFFYVLCVNPSQCKISVWLIHFNMFCKCFDKYLLDVSNEETVIFDSRV